MKREITGVLLLDKPAGISSNAALGRVKRLFEAAKAGHTGTLDPFATGLLPIALGEATKFSRFLLDARKGYRARLKLGVTTTTGDPEGAVVAQTRVCTTETQINAVLARFCGAQCQIPPMYSALKRDGVPLYKLARRGIEVERTPRDITIYELALHEWDGVDRLVIDVLCSKGTYIRVLAEDIGGALACGAHLDALRRTAAGGFAVDAAVTLDELEALDLAGREALLLPAERLAADLPVVTLSLSLAGDIVHGRQVIWPGEDMDQGEYRVYRQDSVFLGVCRLECGRRPGEGKRLVPLRLMSHAGKDGIAQPREFA